MRIFIAVRLRQDVILYLKHLSENLSVDFEKARFTRPENYHITLKFIGETDRRTYDKIIKATKNTAGGIKKFIVKTSDADSFKRKNKHIFYCSLNDSGELMDLYNLLYRNLKAEGLDMADGKYNPHITLAREVVLKSTYKCKILESVDIDVDSISVMESTRVNGKLTYVPRYSIGLGD